jgi:hypothetical protein
MGTVDSSCVEFVFLIVCARGACRQFVQDEEQRNAQEQQGNGAGSTCDADLSTQAGHQQQLEHVQVSVAPRSLDLLRGCHSAGACWAVNTRGWKGGEFPR